MLKGLALTPPIVGRISIGRVVEKNGKRLPEKDDEFTITSQVQTKDGWVNHPVDESLRKSAGGKLRSIPVRLLFDDPDLNLRASYCMFDRASGRPLCVGDGSACKRSTAAGIQKLPCPAPEACELAQGGACKPYGRMNVRIGDEDELGSFIFRTTGFNSIRTLSTRLTYFHAVSGGLLAALPLELRLRGKSTTQSHGTPIYYVDLVTRGATGLTQAIAAAKVLNEERRSSGFDQGSLDAAARKGLASGAFEDSVEEGVAVVEEFYPAGAEERNGTRPSATPRNSGLAEKLDEKARKAKATGAAIP
jgi:Recombination directionality factor-like